MDKVVKVATAAEVEKFRQQNTHDVEKNLRSKGYQLGDLVLNHFLIHFFDTEYGGKSYSTYLKYGKTWQGHLIFENDNNGLKLLRHEARRYVNGINEAGWTIEPPYVVLTHPEIYSKVEGVLLDLECKVERIEKN
ncbi:hypothetical protein ACFL96_08505 [Thermoproteota archaeon]